MCTPKTTRTTTRRATATAATDESSGQEITDITNPKGCIDTRNRVYVVLATPLGDDDEPKVHITGTIRDMAGNAAALTDRLEASDRIAPSLGVTTSGDVETDGRTLAQEDITVTVTAEETLNEVPRVWLATFDQNGKISGVPTEEPAILDGTRNWEAEFGGPGGETLVGAIIVRGEDLNNNFGGGTGWSDKDGDGVPEAGDSLDLAKLEAAGLLVEFDDQFLYDEEMDVALNPSAVDEPLKTESTHPFIELTFREGKENVVSYTVEDEDGEDVTKTARSVEKDGVETKFDSYGRVELSDVTLDGEDASDLVVRVKSAEFDLALANLAVGDHTLEFTATDTAGNSVTKEVDFEVLPRSAYEVDLRPGWNLVSFPGDPVDTAVDSVLPADHPATDVLTYDAGIWISAARGEGNVWEGDLTDIDGQHAYWINTTSTKALEAVLVQPGIGSASRPPSIQLIAGWNLIPVTDLDQADEGEAQENYFSSLPEESFVVAYTYNARDRSWMRHAMGSEGIKNGQGVWVFSRSNTVLIP